MRNVFLAFFVFVAAETFAKCVDSEGEALALASLDARMVDPKYELETKLPRLSSITLSSYKASVWTGDYFFRYITKSKKLAEARVFVECENRHGVWKELYFTWKLSESHAPATPTPDVPSCNSADRERVGKDYLRAAFSRSPFDYDPKRSILNESWQVKSYYRPGHWYGYHGEFGPNSTGDATQFQCAMICNEAEPDWVVFSGTTFEIRVP